LQAWFRLQGMNLQQYLDYLSARQDLLRLSAPVSTDLELAAICRREFARAGGHALLFENVRDSGMRIAANLFGTEERVCQMLQTADFASLAALLQRLSRGAACGRPAGNDVPVPTPYTCCGRLQDIPALRSWPGEKAPYLTLALACSCDPLSGQSNLGLYRAQIRSHNEIALNFSPTSGAAGHLGQAARLGRRLPVALVLGADPALYWAAAAPLPRDCNELLLCQELFGSDGSVTACATQPLLVPASAQVVIEGEIDPAEFCSEGPFANHTGQYVVRADCPLLRVTAVRHQAEPVVAMTVVGPPPSENIHLGAVTELLLRLQLQPRYALISDVFLPRETLYHGVTFIGVSGAGPDVVRELIDNLWADSVVSRAPLLVFVDADIDVHSLSACYWRLINRLPQVRIYENNGRTAIDATGVDPRLLVMEDAATKELLARRQADPGYYRIF